MNSMRLRLNTRLMMDYISKVNELKLYAFLNKLHNCLEFMPYLNISRIYIELYYQFTFIL